ncbi:hypothetical protein KC351_g64 [Hortaea werneckii]|nr:hypothetical protein KC351_g64 [Hortaea werneckii]
MSIPVTRAKCATAVTHPMPSYKTKVRFRFDRCNAWLASATSSKWLGRQTHIPVLVPDGKNLGAMSWTLKRSEYQLWR